MPRAFRPPPGQQTRLRLVAWWLHDDDLPYTWREGDVLADLAGLTCHTPAAILKHNRLTDASKLKPGVLLRLLCYAAVHRMEPGDSYEGLADKFDFEGVKGLTEAAGLGDVSGLHRGLEIKSPGWHFVYARRGDSMASIEKSLALPRGSPRSVGRAYRPDRRGVYEREVVAVGLR